MVRFQKGGWQPIVHYGSLPAPYKVSAVLHLGKESLLHFTLQRPILSCQPRYPAAVNRPSSHAMDYRNSAGGKPTGARTAWPSSPNRAGCIVINRKGELVPQFAKTTGIAEQQYHQHAAGQRQEPLAGARQWDQRWRSTTMPLPPSSTRRKTRTRAIPPAFKNNALPGPFTGGYSAALDKQHKDLSLVKSSFDLLKITKGQAGT